MSSLRLRRIAGVVSSALLAVMVLGPASVSAAPPGWEFLDVEYLPSQVSPGAAAGYTFRIHNGGRSNISQLYLTDSVTAGPVYLEVSRPGCTGVGVDLFCSFGALNADDSITVTIAYVTPNDGSTSFPITFQLNSTGKTFSDSGGNSHGDTKNLPLSTGLSGDANFAGAFGMGDFVVQNGTALGRRNVQSTGVSESASNIPVTVQDGSGVSYSCLGCTGTQFGEWSDVQVAGGDTFGTPFKVVITIFAKSLPGKLKLENVVVYHTYTNSSNVVVTETISTGCLDGDPGPATNPDCLTAVELDNGNLEITLWVVHNGGFKGALG